MESKAYNSQQKGSNNPTLPLELITEILLRLPVKPLLQFRCVSKSWLALISSPQFVKTHLNLSTSHNKDYIHHRILTLNYGRSVSKWCDYNFKERTITSLLYDEPVTKAFDLDYPVDVWSRKLNQDSVVGSVHGLICVKLKSGDLFLWNPSIRKYKKLPHCSPTWHNWFLSIHGFGYNEFHDDYKVVVAFYRSGRRDQVEVKIYSLKSNSWKNVDGYPNGVLLSVSGKYVNHKLHWPATTTTPGIFDIISFDLADKKWEKVEQPYYGDASLIPWLGVLETNLSIFCDNGISYRDLWVMKEYGVKESWIKIFSFNYPSSCIMSMCVPPSFMLNKDEILVYFGSNILIYNSKDGSFRYSKVSNFDVCCGGEHYVESLVCPLST